MRRRPFIPTTHPCVVCGATLTQRVNEYNQFDKRVTCPGACARVYKASQQQGVSPTDVTTDTGEHPCAGCENMVTQLHDEPPSEVRRRKYCSTDCHRAVLQRKRAAALVASADKYCVNATCGKRLTPHAGESPSHFSQRIACNHACAIVYVAKRRRESVANMIAVF